ncbi:rhamnogalacturonan lyase B N-terminal domain-containing protein [Ideonella sp. DXS29W]|uniref:rhamnogalacturonan endolyase n=1 Tax=Ideonella lacteola TaxID=2984193 RepID=A0ABU9BT47_9BURK
MKLSRLRVVPWLLGTLVAASGPACAEGFGLTADATYFTIDTGGGLVFKIRRVDYGSNTQSPGDIASMVYQGVQYQDAGRGSQVNSGFDYLFKDTSAVDVQASQVDADHIKVTVRAGDLVHYYLARRGEPRIYMATRFTREPDTLNLARFILRVPIGALPVGPEPSDIRGNSGAIESGDVFGMPDGQTRSKHYSNMRLKDWRYIGATGPNVGLWVVRDNNEGNSGGPFYRSLLNQGTDTNQEITYIINYGEAQTEPFRPGILNRYTLVFTGGDKPPTIDTNWLADMALEGYVGKAGRGRVLGTKVRGVDGKHDYTIGLSSATAQYWTDLREDGSFEATGVLPGDYTLTVFKNELAVDRRSVTVRAGDTTKVAAFKVTGDPASRRAVWRIGDWDGSPAELLNGDRLTMMHPSDVRMSPWATPAYVVGTSKAKDFPACQWREVNGSLEVRFRLNSDQIAEHHLRLGITAAHAGGRPSVKINQWYAGVLAISSQPSSRTLTVGTYRGNNTLYDVVVPASALVVGDNVLTLGVTSGSQGVGFLSPGFSYDAIDLVPAP